MSRQKYTKETEIGKVYGFLKIVDFTPYAKVDGKHVKPTAMVVCTNCNSAPYKVHHHRLVDSKKPTKSCGCYCPRPTKHGLTNHPYYPACYHAINRCRPTHAKHQDYYDRGITCFWTVETVPEFIAYLETLPPRLPGQSIDRIDNDRGYEPGNIRWASRKEQTNNRRDFITNYKYSLLLQENRELKKENDSLKRLLILAAKPDGIVEDPCQ